MNDVWVTADGGYTWGACTTEACWPDRREMSTVLDRNGFFFVLGGRASASNTVQYNDVYRSSFSFNDLGKVALACQVNIPACGPGLTCWPGASDTVVTPDGVTCPALVRCQSARPRSSSSTGIRRSSSSSTGKKRVIPPYDPCDDDPTYDEYCWNFPHSSSGAGGDKASGLSSWAIGGIVVLVVAVVGGIALFCWRRSRGSGGAVKGPISDSLLGETAQPSGV